LAEKNEELIEVRAICPCSENGENINMDAINVKMTTIVEAGRSRLIRRETKFFKDIAV
jgi:hypothetical protein